MEKLLPCPFCGGEPHFYKGAFDKKEKYDESYKIWCAGCDARIELSPQQVRKIKIDPRLIPQELCDKYMKNMLVTKWNYRADIN